MGRNAKSRVEELKDVAAVPLGAKAHALLGNWCALMGARCSVYGLRPCSKQSRLGPRPYQSLRQGNQDTGKSLLHGESDSLESWSFESSLLKADFYFKISWRVTVLITFHGAIEKHWLLCLTTHL